jgi:predicted amidohydrolase YtcJ
VHPLWAGVEQLNCKLADLVVLDRNLFAIDANEISEAKVLLTLLGGKPVYGNWNDFSD